MGSFRRGILFFRSQQVKFESRPSFLGKASPIKTIFSSTKKNEICYIQELEPVKEKVLTPAEKEIEEK